VWESKRIFNRVPYHIYDIPEFTVSSRRVIAGSLSFGRLTAYAFFQSCTKELVFSVSTRLVGTLRPLEQHDNASIFFNRNIA
jgi:hypothetical protein